jgi:hypothetical protein
MKKFFTRSHSAQYLFHVALAFGFLLFGAASSSAQIITVTNINDSGPGSLRDAITTATATAGAQTIIFDPAKFPPTTPCAAPFLDQSNVGVVTAGTAINISEFAAQVITAGKSGILASVDFALRKFDVVTFGDITVQIRSVTSGAPNSIILGSKTFPNSLIAPTTAEFTTFDLRSLGEISSVLQTARTGFRSVETRGSERSWRKLPPLRARLLSLHSSPSSLIRETASTVVARVSYSTEKIYPLNP